MRLPGSVIVVLLALAQPVTGAPQADPVPSPDVTSVPRMHVGGTATLEYPADQVRIRIGVVTEALQSATALAENTRRMEAVTAALLEVGVRTEEYQTGRFRINPVYSRRPRQADDDWRPRIIGYEVTNDIVIKTQQLDLAGDMIAAANEAGANQVTVVGFELSDPSTYREAAIMKAMSVAFTDARVLENFCGQKIIRVIDLRLDQSNIQPVRNEALMMRMNASDSGPPLEAGMVTVQARVSIVFEIRSSVVMFPPDS